MAWIPILFRTSNFLVYPTETLVAIQCNSKILGAVSEFILGEADDVDTGEAPAYEGALKTPSRKIVIETVEWKLILEMAVPDVTTTVTAWTNKKRSPDIVTIGVS